MSFQMVLKTALRKREHVVAGLVACGVNEEYIEIHDEAVPIRGYGGRSISRNANIIVRAIHFNSIAGYGADIGFEETENGIVVHMDSDQSRWWKKNESKFKRIAARMNVEDHAEMRGYHIEEVEVEPDKIVLDLVKNY